MKHLLFALIIAAALQPMAHATPITLQRGVDGYTGNATARLRDNGLNTGTGNQPFIGDSGNDADNRFTIFFDLTAYAGMTVTGDGALSLHITGVNTAPGSDDFFDLHAIYASNAGWTSANSWSWNYLNAATSNAWKNSSGVDLPLATSDEASPTIGGLGAPGDGYELTPFATLNQNSYTNATRVSITIPQAQLQTWIDGSNAGALVRARDENNLGRLSFRQPTGGIISERPILTFDVAAIPEPSSFALILLGFGLLYRYRSK